VEGGEQFVTLSWLRLPAGATLQATAGPEGTTVWLKTRHLADVAAQLARLPVTPTQRADCPGRD
jgi:hypothetical protein